MRVDKSGETGRCTNVGGRAHGCRLNRLWTVVGAFLILASRTARADVITFNELDPQTTPILGTLVCAATTGFRFSSDHFHVIGANIHDGKATNDTTHIGYETTRGLPILMERVGGGTFSLLSIDAGEFYGPAQTDRPDATTIEILGNVAGGGTVSYTIDLDGIADGPEGQPDFEHFSLPNTFVNLTSVVFAGRRPTITDAGIALDNIEYSVGASETLPACEMTPLPSDIPTITIDTPLPGNVAGTAAIAATVGPTVASVQFKIDDVALDVDATSPFSTSWDTTTVADGPHTVTAEGRDASSAVVATASVVVTVRNTPIDTSNPHFVDFDGTDGYVLVPDHDAISFGNGTTDQPLTVELWFRPDTMDRHQLLGKWGETTNQEYQLQIVSGYLRFDIRDNSAGASAHVLTQNAYSPLVGSWHHLAVTYDGRGGATAANGMSMFVDGVSIPLLFFTDADYVAMENLTDPLQIGRQSLDWLQYDGGLDEIRMWNVVRTESQIQTTITTELTGTEPGLVGYWRFNEGVGVTAGNDAVSHQSAILSDDALWTVGGPMASPVTDTTPPVIANVVTSGTTTSTTIITFQTDEATTAVVSHATAGQCPCTIVASGTTGANHTVALSGLTANTTYSFTVRATDGAGNETTSPVFLFTTLAPPDTTAPTLAIVGPTGGTVSGSVTIEATATDNTGVASVLFSVDGSPLGPAAVLTPYSATWDTTTATNGSHTITVEARDLANNVTTVSLSVIVQNGSSLPSASVVVSFEAAGLWVLSPSSTWTKLHPLSPVDLVTGDLDGNGLDDLVVNFGPGVGIYTWMNHATWVAIHNAAPTRMAIGDLDNDGRDDLVVVFPGSGVWHLSEGTWRRIHPLDASTLEVANLDGTAGEDLLLSFPGFGLFSFVNNQTWSVLQSTTPTQTLAVDLDGDGRSEVLAAIAGSGLWLFRAGAWSRLHPLSPTRMAAGHLDANDLGDVVVDFGPTYGTYVYRNGLTWTRLHPLSTRRITFADRDGSGQDDLLLDFGPGVGLWQYANESVWNRLHSMSTQSNIGGHFE